MPPSLDIELHTYPRIGAIFTYAHNVAPDSSPPGMSGKPVRLTPGILPRLKKALYLAVWHLSMPDDEDDVGFGLLVICITTFCLAEVVDDNVLWPEHPVHATFSDLSADRG